VTLQAYRELLLAFHGYYAGLEAALTCLGQDAEVPDCVVPSRVAALQADLRQLGVSNADLAALPVCRQLPACDTPGQRIGVLYVVNGSTLGGLVLAAHVERHLGTSVSGATDFMRLSGDKTKEHWTGCKVALETMLAKQPDTFFEVVGAAKQTFSTLADWLT
jgi:heme oxygenase